MNEVLYSVSVPALSNRVDSGTIFVRCALQGWEHLHKKHSRLQDFIAQILFVERDTLTRHPRVYSLISILRGWAKAVILWNVWRRFKFFVFLQGLRYIHTLPVFFSIEKMLCLHLLLEVQSFKFTSKGITKAYWLFCLSQSVSQGMETAL